MAIGPSALRDALFGTRSHTEVRPCRVPYLPGVSQYRWQARGITLAAARLGCAAGCAVSEAAQDPHAHRAQDVFWCAASGAVDFRRALNALAWQCAGNSGLPCHACPANTSWLPQTSHATPHPFPPPPAPAAANERTFLSWLAMATTLGTISTAIAGFSVADADSKHKGGISQVGGCW